MPKYKLTIAIPTYNRPVQLEHTLSVVFPQVVAHENVQLLVIDNASPTPAADVLERVTNGSLLPERIRTIRNVANIGGNPNILRCFELAEGEWLWCLSDDDEPSSDAVRIVLKDLAEHAECVYAYYSINDSVPVFGCSDPETIVVDTIEEWVSRVPSLGQRLFISASLFRVDACRGSLSLGHAVAPSGGPHLFMAFLAVCGGGKLFLSQNTIARFVLAPGTWNCVPIVFGMYEIFAFCKSLPMLSAIKSFYRDGLFFWISPSMFLYQLILQCEDMSPLWVGKLYGRIGSLFRPPFLSRPKRYVEYILCRMLSYFPWLFLLAVRLRERVAHRTYDKGKSRGI